MASNKSSLKEKVLSLKNLPGFHISQNKIQIPKSAFANNKLHAIYLCIWPYEVSIPNRASIWVRKRSDGVVLSVAQDAKQEASNYELVLSSSEEKFLQQQWCILKIRKVATLYDHQGFFPAAKAGGRNTPKIQSNIKTPNGIVFRVGKEKNRSQIFISLLLILGKEHKLLHDYIEENFDVQGERTYALAIFQQVTKPSIRERFGEEVYEIATDTLPDENITIRSILYSYQEPKEDEQEDENDEDNDMDFPDIPPPEIVPTGDFPSPEIVPTGDFPHQPSEGEAVEELRAKLGRIAMKTYQQVREEYTGEKATPEELQTFVTQLLEEIRKAE